MNIIIVGATSGIGKALFEKYAKEGNHVGIIGRRKHLLDELVAAFPNNATAKVADVTKQDEIKVAILELWTKMQKVDIAIVCAGTGQINRELDYAKEQPTLDTNVMGWTFVVDMLYNLLSEQGKGRLASISSVGGLRGEALAPAYSATKAFQINYLEALRKKAYKNGNKIHITDLRPGFVDTAMAQGDGLFWVMPVEKAAKQICNAIRRGKGKAYITKRWRLIAVLYKALPFTLFKKL